MYLLNSTSGKSAALISRYNNFALAEGGQLLLQLSHMQECAGLRKKVVSIRLGVQA